MNTILKNTLLGGALLFSSSAVLATPITRGGVTWDPASIDDFFSTDTIYESTVSALGDVLGGYGKITNLNGETNNNLFCGGCELTYQFGGYTLAGIVDTNGDGIVGNAGDNSYFTGGWINFYVDFTADFTTDNFASAGAEGGTNQLWLSLQATTQSTSFDGGATTVTGSLFSSITTGSLGTGTEGGNGFGNLNAVGGLTVNNFDTNTQANGSDFRFTSQFQPRTCGTNGTCPSQYKLTGANTLVGNSIPEPTSLALLGLGLLGFGATRKRK